MNQGWTKLYKEILSGPATLNTRKMYAAFYYETTQRGDGWPKFSLSKLHWASVDTGWLMTVWSIQQSEEGGGRGGEMRLKETSPILSFIDWRILLNTRSGMQTGWLFASNNLPLVPVVLREVWSSSRKTGSQDVPPNVGAGMENTRSPMDVVIWKLLKDI